jgi:AraC-like DNA-binding protein
MRALGMSGLLRSVRLRGEEIFCCAPVADSVIGEAMTAIHANPGHPWTVKRLADKCNLSRSAFSERFVRTVGQPPAAYIAQVRLEKAADLLQYTTDAVGAIAREIGYDSEAAFSRAFSKRHGVPPARWRRQPARLV